MTERAVVVTTEFRGVFFGWTEDTSGARIQLKRARNCIYWTAATGGFMGLAAKGPATATATADFTPKKWARAASPRSLSSFHVACCVQACRAAGAVRLSGPLNPSAGTAVV